MPVFDNSGNEGEEEVKRVLLLRKESHIGEWNGDVAGERGKARLPFLELSGMVLGLPGKSGVAFQGVWIVPS